MDVGYKRVLHSQIFLGIYKVEGETKQHLHQNMVEGFTFQNVIPCVERIEFSDPSG